MTMQYWLMKTEPETFGWKDLVKDGKACWDGVRNFAARNNLAAMKKGDQVLIYHSVNDKAVVGIAEVKKEAYPDPTSDDKRWMAVDVIPKKPLKHPVTLAQVKADPRLKNTKLVTQSRLSVMPLQPDEYDAILQLSQNA